MISLGRMLVILGILLLVAGALVLLVERLGLPLGNLPGDIRVQRENFTCIFPLATMILLSVLLTLGLNLISRFLNK